MALLSVKHGGGNVAAALPPCCILIVAALSGGERPNKQLPWQTHGLPCSSSKFWISKSSTITWSRMSRLRCSCWPVSESRLAWLQGCWCGRCAVDNPVRWRRPQVQESPVPGTHQVLWELNYPYVTRSVRRWAHVKLTWVLYGNLT